MKYPAQLTFVSNLFTSKIFLAQIVTLVATILNAMGYKVLDDPGMQQQVITGLDVVATILLRWLASNTAVSISAPLSTPASRDVEAGVSVVTVVGADEQRITSAPAVQKLETGKSTVAVLSPRLPDDTAPSDVVITGVNP